MKIKHVILLISCFIYSGSFAQELRLAASSQYLADNPYVVSAAYAGIGEFYQLRLSGVSQWVGIKNAPETQAISFDARIADRSGVGMILYNDSNRMTSQKGGQISFAQHMTLSERSNQFLSLGLSYKFTNFNIDISNLGAAGSADTAVQTYNTFNSNFDISFLYRIESFFFSFSAVNILDKKINRGMTAEPTKLRNYYAYTGFLIKNRFSSLEFEPSIFYQQYESDGRSTADVNFKVRKKSGDNFMWAGLTLRMLGDQSFKPNSIAPIFGFKKNIFYAAYAYEASLNEIQGYNNGTHMITLGLDFKGRRSPCKCAY